VSIEGYAAFQAGDFNGANVLLRDNNTWVLYFKDWNNFDKTNRAVGDTLPKFQLTGVALQSDTLVNDVKKFVVQGKTWFLMGLHRNTEQVWYSLSNDGVSFNPQQTLFASLSSQDRWIVSLGFLTKDNKLLGVLYGASNTEGLSDNRIFARWLQKKISITNASRVQHLAQGDLGPDRQRFQAPESGALEGTIIVYAEDGMTPLASGSVNAIPGRAYLLVLKE
jgi:hypothetical protein